MKSFAQEMAFYSAYHQERRNVLIHVVGVPTITFSLLTVMSLWKLYTFENGFALTFAMVFLAATLLYYFYLDLTFGLVSTIVYGGLAVGAHFVALQGTTPALIVFGAGQLLGWGTQIYGHAAFEGNRPAFLDNLFQALFSAPLFVIADVFFHLGLRKDLESEIKSVLREQGRLREDSTGQATA